MPELLTEGGSAYLIHPWTGETLAVPEAEAGQMISAGMKPATRKQYEALKKSEHYGSGGMAALAGVAGVARGATLGLSDLALTKSGAVAPETLAGLQQYNPTASTVGDIAGMAGGMLLPAGPLAALGKLGGGAGKLATRGAAKLTGKTALDAIPRLAGTLASETVAGAGYGAGYGLSQFAMSGEEASPEAMLSILAKAGEGAALGAAGGAIFGTAGAVGRAAAGKITRGTRRLKALRAEAKSVKQELAGLEEAGAPLGQIEATRARLQTVSEAVQKQQVEVTGRLFAKSIGAGIGSVIGGGAFGGVAGYLVADQAVRSFAKALTPIGAKLDTVLKKFTARAVPVADRIEGVLGRVRAAPGGEELLSSMGKKIRAKTPYAEEAIAKVKGIVPGGLPAHKYKNQIPKQLKEKWTKSAPALLEDEIYTMRYAIPRWRKHGINEAWTPGESLYNKVKATSAWVNRRKPGAPGRARAKESLSVAREMLRTIQKEKPKWRHHSEGDYWNKVLMGLPAKAHNKIANFLETKGVKIAERAREGLEAFAAKSPEATTAAIHAVGHGAGAALGHIAEAAPDKALHGFMFGGVEGALLGLAHHHAAHKIKERTVGKFIDAMAHRVVPGVQRGSVKQLLGDAKDEAEEIRAMDVNEVETALRAQFPTNVPRQIQDSVILHVTGALKYLQAEAPRMPQEGVPTGRAPKVPETEIARFRTKLEAVVAPESMIQAFADGKLTIDQVRAWERVYPGALKQLRALVKAQVAEAKAKSQKFTAKQAKQIAMLLGDPAHPATDPRRIGIMRQMYAATQQPAPGPSPQAASLDIASKHATTMNRIGG